MECRKKTVNGSSGRDVTAKRHRQFHHARKNGDETLVGMVMIAMRQFSARIIGMVIVMAVMAKVFGMRAGGRRWVALSCLRRIANVSHCCVSGIEGQT